MSKRNFCFETEGVSNSIIHTLMEWGAKLNNFSFEERSLYACFLCSLYNDRFLFCGSHDQTVFLQFVHDSLHT